MEQESKLTALCYTENKGAYLIFHRISKENSVGKDKWIGVGGHSGGDESPEDCLLREVREKTGLTLTPWRLRGLVIFRTGGWGTGYMYLYTVDKYEREMTTCNRGTLERVRKGDVLSLNLWEGDKIFFKLLNEDVPFFLLKLSYKGNRPTEAVLNGRQMELSDVLDEDGRKTGVVRERNLVHMNGVPHGTVRIWAVRKDEDKIYNPLLQEQSRGRDSYPGCYDIPLVGRVQARDEFLPSAVRELKEELGIEAREEDLESAGFHKGYIEDMLYGNMFRNSKVSAVRVYRKTVYADQLTSQKGEVENVMWMELGQCVEVAKNHGIPNRIYLDELEMIERYSCWNQEKQQITGYREHEWALGIPPRGVYLHLDHCMMKKITKEVSVDVVFKVFRPDENKPDQYTPCMGE